MFWFRHMREKAQVQVNYSKVIFRCQWIKKTIIKLILLNTWDNMDNKKNLPCLIILQAIILS